jgi:hypothetical protein
VGVVSSPRRWHHAVVACPRRTGRRIRQFPTTFPTYVARPFEAAHAVRRAHATK